MSCAIVQGKSWPLVGTHRLSSRWGVRSSSARPFGGVAGAVASAAKARLGAQGLQRTSSENTAVYYESQSSKAGSERLRATAASVDDRNAIVADLAGLYRGGARDAARATGAERLQAGLASNDGAGSNDTSSRHEAGGLMAGPGADPATAAPPRRLTEGGQTDRHGDLQKATDGADCNAVAAEAASTLSAGAAISGDVAAATNSMPTQQVQSRSDCQDATPTRLFLRQGAFAMVVACRPRGHIPGLHLCSSTPSCRCLYWRACLLQDNTRDVAGLQDFTFPDKEPSAPQLPLEEQAAAAASACHEGSTAFLSEAHRPTRSESADSVTSEDLLAAAAAAEAGSLAGKSISANAAPPSPSAPSAASLHPETNHKETVPACVEGPVPKLDQVADSAELAAHIAQVTAAPLSLLGCRLLAAVTAVLFLHPRSVPLLMWLRLQVLWAILLLER
jgi:hypothetical protein